MSAFYISILITIIANALYHFFQKSIPQNVPPTITLIITYGTALLTCIVYLAVSPPLGGILIGFRRANWSSVALGISIIGMELGFLLAYRAGWDISLAGIVSATGVALVLIPIGLSIFKEHLSPLNLIGVTFCIAGLILVNWR